MGVRARITSIYVVVMSAVLVSLSIVLVARLRSELRASIDTVLRARSAELVADIEEEPPGTGNEDAILDRFDNLAQVLDVNGKVVESTAPTGSASIASPAGVASDATVAADGEPSRVRVLTAATRNGYTVVVGAPLSEADGAVVALTRLLALSGPAVLALTAAAVWALTGRALRPVDRLRAEAEILSFAGDTRRLAVPATRDEVAALARTLNGMLDRVEASLERERRFVDDASHELRTPLAVLRTELELALSRARTNDELVDAIRSATEEVDSLWRLAEQLLVLARSDRGRLPAHRSHVDIVAMAASVASTAARPIEVTNGDAVWADVDEDLIRRALANLVNNAVANTPPGGRVWIEVIGEPLEVVVSDTGPGFDPDLLPRAFEAFTRADGARGRGSGAGLGLAIVKAIAQAHGGTADASNLPGGGARVSLRLSRR